MLGDPGRITAVVVASTREFAGSCEIALIHGPGFTAAAGTLPILPERVDYPSLRDRGRRRGVDPVQPRIEGATAPSGHEAVEARDPAVRAAQARRIGDGAGTARCEEASNMFARQCGLWRGVGGVGQPGDPRGAVLAEGFTGRRRSVGGQCANVLHLGAGGRSLIRAGPSRLEDLRSASRWRT